MNPQRHVLTGALIGLLAAGLSACGGGSGSVPLSGSLSGLAAGANLTLSDGPTTVALSSNGAFQFADGSLSAGSAYDVTVAQQPAGEACSVSNGSGAVDPNGDPVAGIVVACVPAASVGGSVAGLAAGTSVSVSDGLSTLTLAANGGFAFADPFVAGAPYNVAITSQPAGQACSLVNASGSIDALATPVATLGVQCSANGTVGGTVTGLAPGSTLTLSDGVSTLAVQANGLFAFADTYAAGAAYQVAVTGAPAGQSCTVGQGSGNVDGMGDAVNNVVVSCLASGSLNGTVTGLAAGATVTLSDGNTSVTVVSNGAFAFSDLAAAGASYGVGIVGQPGTGSCAVTGNVSGSFDANDDAVSGVVVTCG